MTDTRPAPYPADTRAKGWRFELEYERIEQSDTWAIAEEVPMAQHALLFMWLSAWKQEPCGSLPNDEAVIRSKCRIPPKLWPALRAVLLRGWWLADDGRLYHPTITARVMEMLEYRRKTAERVAKHKAAMRGERVGNALPTQPLHVKNDTGTGTGTGTNIEEQIQDPPPASLSDPPAKTPSASRGSRRCPESFDAEPLRSWAAAESPRADFDRELAKFRDHTFKAAHSDWLAAFRNWLRKASDDAINRPVSFQAQREAEAAKWMNPQAGRANFDFIDMEATDAAPIAIR